MAPRSAPLLFVLLLVHGAASFVPSNKIALKDALVEWGSDATTAETEYGHISTWNTSAITDMAWLFCSFYIDASSAYPSGTRCINYGYCCIPGLATFNEILDGWDTSSVTSMDYMFYYAEAFNQPLDFDTSSVNTMVYMFKYAVFNQPLDFNTSSVTNMAGMFSRTEAFNQPLDFDTSSVTSMNGMFYFAEAFNQPLDFDTSSVTDIAYMFHYAYSFDQVVCFDTSSVTGGRGYSAEDAISGMFDGSNGTLCPSPTPLPTAPSATPSAVPISAPSAGPIPAPAASPTPVPTMINPAPTPFSVDSQCTDCGRRLTGRTLLFGYLSCC